MIEDMGAVEEVFFWATVFAYLFSFVSYLVAAVFKKAGAETIGWYALLTAFGLHTTAIGIRWVDTGHPPVVSRFENTLAGTWFMVFLLVLLDRWFKRVKPLGLFITPIALMMLGFGMLAGTELKPIAPNFQSGWLWVHVTFAWVAYGSFMAAGGLGIAFLLKRQLPDGGGESRFLRLFPDLPYLEDIILKLVLFGFIGQSFMILSGSIWAESLWGNYWSWDPLETWALVTWLTYGIIIHFRLTLGWKGRRIAWMTAGAIVTEVITFWGIGFISNLHTPLF